MKDIQEPLKIYLDSSDFQQLSKSSRNKNPKNDDIFRKLIGYKNNKSVKYYYSFYHMFELITRYDEEYRRTRDERARIINALCDGNCLIHPMSVIYNFGTGTQNEMLNNKNKWFPIIYDMKPERIILKNLKDTMKKIGTTTLTDEELLKSIKSKTNFKNLGYSKYMVEYLRNDNIDTFHKMYGRLKNPTNFIGEMSNNQDSLIQWIMQIMEDTKMAMTQSFEEFKIINQSKKIKLINLYNDLMSVDYIEFMMNQIFDSYKVLDPLQSMLSNSSMKLSKNRYWKNHSEIYSIYLYHITKHNLQVERGDWLDIEHGIYRPYMDLTRSDTRFSTILKMPEYAYSQSHKMVEKLEDLPDRIGELCQQFHTCIPINSII